MGNNKDITLSIQRSSLSGIVIPPSSKSLAHRVLICAALSAGKSSVIHNITLSKDISATVDCVRKLGAKVKVSEEGSTIFVEGYNPDEVRENTVCMDCSESGSTLRFMIPVAAAVGGSFSFTGHGRLSERPVDIYKDIFERNNLEFSQTDGRLPLYTKGVLKSGIYHIRGDVSSQFISGLLFALPLLDGDSSLFIDTKLESEPYVDLTIEAQNAFGIKIERIVTNEGLLCYFIRGNQKYKGCEYTVEGDYSQAAFWETANYLGAKLNINGMNENSIQGDKAILSILQRISSEREITVDASQIPDLVPILSVAASLTEGTVTNIINAGRLRIKESDRLAAVREELNKLGADIEEKSDGLLIKGVKMFNGGRVKAHNDHRIAMSIAVAALKCGGDIILEGADCVDKSYPDFWNEYVRLGGKANEFNMGK